ncbi:hypothetical protein L3X38_001530 [Prunus dulcis]|uniref:Uncharacterized protein n=1 Tax=Prunus dulcis TaxID=3755 RepID=A0AAD4WSQ6_PRUDU|nr:hypothetical protein L3X38_001530 [Prunus dulcis]
MVERERNGLLLRSLPSLGRHESGLQVLERVCSYQGEGGAGGVDAQDNFAYCRFLSLDLHHNSELGELWYWCCGDDDGGMGWVGESWCGGWGMGKVPKHKPTNFQGYRNRGRSPNIRMN